MFLRYGLTFAFLTNQKNTNLNLTTIMKKINSTLLIGLLFVGLNAQNPADLDPTFGNGGIVTTALSNDRALANDMLIQPDGKIVVAGEVKSGLMHFGVARYNSDGSLDTDFGTNGIVLTTYGGDAWGKGVALQSDGSIIVTGLTYSSATSYKALVARYTPNGVLDNTFGVNGLTILPGLDNSMKVVIQPDDKIIVGGFTNDNFALSRLNADGTIDTSYGDNGFVVTHMKDPAGIETEGFIQNMALQSDGKLVAVGFTNSFTTYYDVAVARYNENGTLDYTFNNVGYFITDLGEYADFGISVKIQPDNKILVGGHKETDLIPEVPDYDMVVLRLNPNGTIDQSFGANGFTYIRTGAEASYNDDIELQSDGKILFTGQAATYSTQKFEILVGRLNSDGTIDTSFGDGGYRFYDPFGTPDHTKSIKVDNDGKIVLAGYSTLVNNGKSNFRVMRLMGDAESEPIPAVNVTFNNVTPTTFDVTLTPNQYCSSYYFVAMTMSDLEMWLPMMGSMPNLIKAWGINKTESYTHHYADMVPDTEYYIFSLSIDNNAIEAPYDSAYVHTLPIGGAGEASAIIELSEITQTSVRMIVTPNEETAVFHDGLITKEYFDEIGQEAAIDIFKNNEFPLYETDNWVWSNLIENTEYKAVAVCKNSIGEWGNPVIVDFITLNIVSINGIDFSTVVVYPNPGNGKFNIVGSELIGANLRIVDLNGKEIYRNQLNDTKTTIDITNHVNGMYIIEIEKNGNVSSSKILKK